MHFTVISIIVVYLLYLDPLVVFSSNNSLAKGSNKYNVAIFAGTRCQTNINECSSSPCLNGGICTDGVNKYTCACQSGYGGNFSRNPFHTICSGEGLRHIFLIFLFTRSLLIAGKGSVCVWNEKFARHFCT